MFRIFFLPQYFHLIKFKLSIVGLVTVQPKKYSIVKVAFSRARSGRGRILDFFIPVSYTHLTLPTNREV